MKIKTSKIVLYLTERDHGWGKIRSFNQRVEGSHEDLVAMISHAAGQSEDFRIALADLVKQALKEPQGIGQERLASAFHGLGVRGFNV